MTEPDLAVKPSGRILAVDYFRGLAVLLMLIYDYVPFFTKNVPLILQHGREDQFLFGDLVAPFFLFIMGFSLALSVSKRKASGSNERQIFESVLTRSLLLLGIGLAIDISRGWIIWGQLQFRWGVLETLGVSYLVSYLVMRFRYLDLQLFALSILLGIHLFLSVFSSYRAVLRSISHGSPFSVLSWAAIAIIGMICGERFTKNYPGFENFMIKAGILFVLLGSVISPFNPLTKRLVSSSYALFSSGLSILLFLLLYYLIENRKFAVVIKLLKPLREFGIAALLAWALQYVVAVYFIYYFHKYGKLQPLYGITLAMAMILVVWIIVCGANQRGIRIKI